MPEKQSSLEEALDLALKLSSMDKVRLLERVAATLEREMQAAEIGLEDDDPVEEFRQAWHEAMTGQTFPIEELWDGNR